MTAWLSPVATALAQAERPVRFFFRDDDAGWGRAPLHRLLDVFEAADAPIDLAVIPAALDCRLARELTDRAAGQVIRPHQHGFRHQNHEPDGRPCEFGPSRTPAQQLADVESGRLRLGALLECEVDPIFTPPWNRCTESTGTAVVAAGLGVLSRELRAPALANASLVELPISVDWFARKRGMRVTRAELAAQLAARVYDGGPVGVMLHHAVMDADERQAVGELLAVLARSDRARFATMADIALARVVS